jgi:hypothetical protein
MAARKHLMREPSEAPQSFLSITKYTPQFADLGRRNKRGLVFCVAKRSAVTHLICQISTKNRKHPTMTPYAWQKKLPQRLHMKDLDSHA